jgi:RNA polymerase sigma-70 factor (ECF subfamily)
VSEVIDRAPPHGDRTAEFEALFRAHYAPLCRFLNAIVRSRDVAEELAQDVFLRVWERHDSPDAAPITPGYLFGAAHNRALQYLRHQRVVSRWAERVGRSLDASAITPADDLAERDLAGALDAAIADLPERCRLVFTLSREQHLTYSEIAQILGISVKTVETQMWRALKALRLRLAPFLALVLAALPSAHWMGRVP